MLIAAIPFSTTFLWLQVLLQTPILLESELDNIKANSGLQLQSFSLHYKTGHENALKEALSGLCSNIEEQVSFTSPAAGLP